MARTGTVSESDDLSPYADYALRKFCVGAISGSGKRESVAWQSRMGKRH